MRIWRGLVKALATALAFATATAIPAQVPMGNPSLDQAAAAMRPGQFVLDDDRAAPGFANADMPVGAPVTIAVSIAMQRLYVYRGAELVAVSTVSTGKSGKRTPLGDFTILQKRRFHRSNIYSNAPMPFMQRLTWTGIAIHAGHLPGFPASHGCVRVPIEFARTLFGMTALGDAVSVADWPPHTPVYLEVEWNGLGFGATPSAPVIEMRPARPGSTIYLDYDLRVISWEFRR